jgi:hypothetical protein
VWADTRTSDERWYAEVSVLPLEQLRALLPLLRSTARATQRRVDFVKTILDLEPSECHCDMRWTSSFVSHEDGCPLRCLEDTAEIPVITPEPEPEPVLCRKCGQPITGYRFGSQENGWEHMVGQCSAQEQDDDDNDEDEQDGSTTNDHDPILVEHEQTMIEHQGNSSAPSLTGLA